MLGLATPLVRAATNLHLSHYAIRDRRNKSTYQSGIFRDPTGNSHYLFDCLEFSWALLMLCMPVAALSVLRCTISALRTFFKRLVSICKSSRRSFCLLLNYWKKSPTSTLLARRHRPLSVFSGCFMSRFLKCCRASAQTRSICIFFCQKSHIRMKNVGNKQKPVEASVAH